MRKLFGKDEACYVMDAKIMGNVGRYFNVCRSFHIFVKDICYLFLLLSLAPFLAFMFTESIRSECICGYT